MSLFDRLSPIAKRICIAITLPSLLISIYLFFSESTLMLWITEWRQAFIGTSEGWRREYAFELLIIFIVIGLPSMLPAIIYDLMQKRRRISIATESVSGPNRALKQNILQFILFPKPPKLKTRVIRKSLRQKYGKEVILDAAKDGNSGVIQWNGFVFSYMCIDAAMPRSEFSDVSMRSDGDSPLESLIATNQAHALVTPLYIPEQPGAKITAAIFVMSVSKMIFETGQPLAYYWSSSRRLFDTGVYYHALDTAEAALAERRQSSGEFSHSLPLDYWLSFETFSYDKGLSFGLISRGMASFFKFEIHFEPLTWGKREIFDRFIGTAAYLFDRGQILKTGDTLGASETEQFRISLSQGSLKQLPRLTLRLEKIDPSIIS